MNPFEQLAREHNGKPTIGKVVEFFSDYFGVDVTNKSRKREVAWPRHLAGAYCKSLGYSYVQIGKKIKRDHTTVMLGAWRVKDQIRRIREGKQPNGKDIPIDLMNFLLTRWQYFG